MSDRLPVQPRKSRKLSLKFILIGQFAILIVGISGLMAWLSWRSEQEMIANLLKWLMCNGFNVGGIRYLKHPS